MSSHTLETIMGAVVLVVAVLFLNFAYQSSNVRAIDGYGVTANFSNLTGIGTGSDVRLGGIKIGVVKQLALDAENFTAVAHLQIENFVKLPKDSSAAIQSAGLLGEKFIAIEPGGDDRNLQEGDAITFTQDSVSLEELIGKFVFSGGGVDEEESPATEADAEPAFPSLGLE